jgi:hypothetical protein
MTFWGKIGFVGALILLALLIWRGLWLVLQPDPNRADGCIYKRPRFYQDTIRKILARRRRKDKARIETLYPKTK